MTLVLEILKWWFIASFAVLPFALALMRANGPEPRPAPRLVVIQGGKRVEGR